MATYTLKDTSGRVVLSGVPEDDRTNALRIATMIDGDIRGMLARRTGVMTPLQTFTWEVEDPTPTETYSVYSLEPDED